ncbi:MAG: (E)-4-hydroxy-3-methylbut-2-enyl-diphosphate synthase [Akkermansiaceae bacterium]|jgi:(E)-4-hydroxy-3-methylbut-2-enyl-diphosphate synthase|nr:(E)-4-hydroxy-3-methylbut-2-enyl-diphosphate synthase [Akkermansiaceae bacterium]MDP4779320.1 (E)-4-hydroxy-3-methylbut-2-enyl-diphosphate synthase [Akkermansiaceae bacterium]MDP4846484.1 (E)-4-hydroxy-3-methylbut-2-enyl-diphosphate synthase [Akkermansiaceae bacterium]MDP4896528.1 (E)-4-hydroxy-3-methylbut-2-enyl-diphosphate synthase [Akkermansiaceae bacterium]MDP4995269.1 (E)-4-hydroxy-3-methylbut-2-enyl-diphosphate synthase [Akkermansiaceae bacterium]
MSEHTALTYCPDLLSYTRRKTREVMVGNVGVGGENPIRVQSMITSDTRDTPACVAEVLALAEAGCEIVRITAQTKVYAANLENIAREVRAAGCNVPLVADIHFKPDAAMEAAKWVEKIRVNPGNYVDKKKFEIREYSDDQYEAELEKIRDQFIPLVTLCKDLSRAMRIGTNHGSLSDRIMNRYGDTPLGMCESALEFARIARDNDYHNFVFSMKASNPKVMIEAYRLLVARLDAEGADWNYPIHLGVTEAGDGEDGRIKSVIGIGSLLADGIGDTIRVSLTEDAIHEIPVAQALVDLPRSPEKATATFAPSYDPFSYERRSSSPITIQGHELGGDKPVRVFTTQERWNALAHKIANMGDFKPEIITEKSGVIEIDPRDASAFSALNSETEPRLITVADGIPLAPIHAFRMLAFQADPRHPILLKDTLNPPSGETDFLEALLPAAQNIGSLLCDGIGDAILVRGETAPGQSLRLAYNILQAAGTRIFKTDYVACPSCGRTLFNLQSTTQKIRASTGHLKGVRIAVMGCIVNGPGEMADADFGYVGGAPGKINLYVGKTAVKFNIPEAEAVERLIDLIREHGKWIDAPPQPSPATA